MSQQYTKSFKVCATCEYWMGPRKINNFCDRVTVDNPMCKGKCASRTSGYRNTERQANASLSCYEKWAVLK